MIAAPKGPGIFSRLSTAFNQLLPTDTTGGGYDAVKGKNKRKSPSAKTTSGDAELLPEQRRRLVSGSRDIGRNFSIAAWMIRKHLDYVSTFSFQAKTGIEALDEKLEHLMHHWSKRDNCDAAGRHGFRRIVRLAEARRTVDGDVGILKLTNGKLQAIEGDRIRAPLGTVSANWNVPGNFYWGVETDAAGKALQYSICKRLGHQGSFEFERMVPAKNLYLHGYFDRFDQTRGISPLASAVNSLRDTYEGFDYALAKMKVSQLFGLVITSSNPEGTEILPADPLDGEKYDVDVNAGTFKLEMDPNEKAEFLESRTPSTEFQTFTQAIIGVSLKALDIPFSFYAENFSNYSGSRQALLMYEQSAACKREDVREMLDEITKWRIYLWWLDGELPGVDLNAIRWGWIPAGLPWIDPEKEVNAEIAQVNGALDNPEDIAQRHGKNFYENVDKIARCRAYAESKGVPLSYVLLPTAAPEAPEPVDGKQAA